VLYFVFKWTQSKTYRKGEFDRFCLWSHVNVLSHRKPYRITFPDDEIFTTKVEQLQSNYIITEMFQRLVPPLSKIHTSWWNTFYNPCLHNLR